MTRLKTRRTLKLESLESRELLSGPTNDEQYMLQLVNLARTNPPAMVSWLESHVDANDMATMAHYGVNLQTELSEIGSSTPVQPLAWNDTLAATAQEQSQYEVINQIQTHQGPGELDLNGRLDAAGYTNRVVEGENSYAYAQSVDHAMKAFLIDWGVPGKGHRGNLLQPNTTDANTYTAVGIGIVDTAPGSSVGPEVITQDFGRQVGDQPQVVGVVFNDKNGDNFYSPGEGKGGVTVELDDANGKEVGQAQTWASGGYKIALPAGSPTSPTPYTVKVLDSNGNPIQQQAVTIGTDNVEADFNLNQASNVPAVSASTKSAKSANSMVTPNNNTVVSNLHFDSSWATSWWTWTQSNS